MKTHALVLDTTLGSFSLLNDSETKVLKAYKTWDAKIKKSQRIEVPSDDDLPNSLSTNAILWLRVVKIPEKIQEGLKKLQDPRIKQFLNKANNFSSNFQGEDTGLDLLDGGYK